MEKVIVTSLSTLSCYFLLAQPVTDSNRFSTQLTELINHSKKNFKDLPQDYKFEGAIGSKTERTNINNTIYQIAIAGKISEEEAKKVLEELRQRIVLILGDRYSLRNKGDSSEIIFIEKHECDSNYSMIKLRTYNKSTEHFVFLEFYADTKNQVRSLSNRSDTSNLVNLDLIKRAKTIVVGQLGVDENEVTFEASFTNDLGADSLDTVELIMEFEKEFNLLIPDEDAECITTFGQAIAYLIDHQK